MSGQKLTLSQLMEGGLAQLMANPIPVGLFVVVDASSAYGLLWAGAHYGLGFATSIAIALAIYALASSLLILSIGGGARQVLADPAEIFVRLVFALAASLIVVVGAALGLVLLIVPGLYVLARWTIVPQLILLEGAGIGEALSRGWALTENSAWALVAVGLIASIPDVLFGIFGGGEVGVDLLKPALNVFLELFASASIAAFHVAVAVFAYTELSERPDRLAETFA